MEEKNNEREFCTLVDEDGKEINFEVIAEVKYKDKHYYAMIPADAADQAQEANDGFCEYVILREEKDEKGENTLVTVDDDDEFDDVADQFDDMFSEEIDYD